MDINEIDPLTSPKQHQWYSAPHHATWLSALINSPEGALFLDVLREQALPNKVNPAAVPGDSSYLDRLAIIHTHNSGRMAAVDSILALRNPIQTPEELGEAWATDR
jgi:hypothetical protein